MLWTRPRCRYKRHATAAWLTDGDASAFAVGILSFALSTRSTLVVRCAEFYIWCILEMRFTTTTAVHRGGDGSNLPRTYGGTSGAAGNSAFERAGAR